MAAVATSYRTSRSVVFHHGGAPPPPDPVRGIDYAATRLSEVHVRASAAIPVLFPAVEVTRPSRAAGWYGDGGTRLNTPLKPALRLGADPLVVIGLTSIASTREATEDQRPDIFAGAAQMLQAGLADQLANDVATLVMVNRLLGGGGTASTAEPATRRPPTDPVHLRRAARRRHRGPDRRRDPPAVLRGPRRAPPVPRPAPARPCPRRRAQPAAVRGPARRRGPRTHPTV